MTMRETDLYPPIKALLEAQGYEVKGEINGADVVGIRAGEAPVIIELKAKICLALFHQAVMRQTLTDDVYVAVPQGSGRAWQASLKSNVTLCRRLGLGLLLVRLDDGHVDIRLDPGPYRPRVNQRRKGRLLREFARREGDPTPGGSPPTGGLVTAYRQDAIRLATHLAAHGPTRGAQIAQATGVARATRMMADDHYGWFERVARGIYAVTPRGAAAVAQK